MTYVMHEDMFESLLQVNGFANLNGQTYQQHLVIILKLAGDIKKEVLESESVKDAKDILKKYDIEFTHDFNQQIQND